MALWNLFCLIIFPIKAGYFIFLAIASTVVLATFHHHLSLYFHPLAGSSYQFYKLSCLFCVCQAEDCLARFSCRLAQEWHAWHAQSLVSSVETTALRCWYIRGWLTLLQWNHRTSDFFVAPHTLTALMCLIAGLVCFYDYQDVENTIKLYGFTVLQFFFKVCDGKREISICRELFWFGNGRKKCFFFLNLSSNRLSPVPFLSFICTC